LPASACEDKYEKWQIVVDIQNDYFPGGAFPREESMLPVKPVCVLLRKHVKQGG